MGYSAISGVNLTMCSSGDYGTLYEDETVGAMPCYPEDTVVVKVSDY